MNVRPIVCKSAKGFIALHHRHSRPVRGWLFGCSLVADGEVVAVASAGRPPRMLQDGVTVEVTRVCTLGHPNACSQLYGAVCRAARALGYTRAVTYKLKSEPGTSLLAAGFRYVCDVREEEWSRPSRPRESTREVLPRERWERAL